MHTTQTVNQNQTMNLYKIHKTLNLADNTNCEAIQTENQYYRKNHNREDNTNANLNRKVKFTKGTNKSQPVKN